jgi:hypothetical protein
MVLAVSSGLLWRHMVGRSALCVHSVSVHITCTGVLWDVSTQLCAAAPPPGLYGVGTGVLWDVSTQLCAAAPPPGLYGVGTGVLWDVSTPCAVVPPPGL